MIKEFFENREIFITGGSGVVGKALIEKLLRSCNVGKIYILLRGKRKLSTEQRLAHIKSDMIFRQLNLLKPDELEKKLFAVPGDILLPLLGITPEHKKVLENVSLVFHSAATIRFDEPLKGAINLNVGGTLNALKFAETLKNLQMFMYVSTFFSNPYLKRVEEKIYKAAMDWKVCLKLAQSDEISEPQLNAITTKLTVGFVNTYCFTKHLAESLVNDYRDKLPLAIFRPSIVISAIEEPEPAFLSTDVGAMGVVTAMFCGLIKVHYGAKDLKHNVIPMDIAIKCLCFYTVKAAQLYQKKPKPNAMPVYITTGLPHLPVSVIQDWKIVNGTLSEAAFEKSFFTPGFYMVENRLLYSVMVWFMHLLPALLIDFILILMRRKPVLLKLQRKIFSTAELFTPFNFNSYESRGITDFDDMLTTCGGTEFNIDILGTTNKYYRRLAMLLPMAYGIRKYVLKEDPRTLPRSRQIFQVKLFITKMIKLLLAFKICEILLNILRNFYSKMLARN